MRSQQSVSAVARPRDQVGTRHRLYSTNPPKASGLVQPSPAIWAFTNGVSLVDILCEPDSPNYVWVVFVPKFCVESDSLGCRSMFHRRAAPARSIVTYSNLFLINTVTLDSCDLGKRPPRRPSAHWSLRLRLPGRRQSDKALPSPRSLRSRGRRSPSDGLSPVGRATRSFAARTISGLLSVGRQMLAAGTTPCNNVGQSTAPGARLFTSTLRPP